jgi:hypothetical protein
VVVAAVVVLVFALNSGDDRSRAPHRSTTERSIPLSAASGRSGPSGVSASSGAQSRPVNSPVPRSALLRLVPFRCVALPVARRVAAVAADEVQCSGPDVETKVSAQRVTYSLFANRAGLDGWYASTVLGRNGLRRSVGDCRTGSLVDAAGGAQYCEGALGGGAREVIVQGPASNAVRIGNSSTTAACPGSEFSLLATTLPDRRVGVVAVTCSAGDDAGGALQQAATSGAFDLR